MGLSNALLNSVPLPSFRGRLTPGLWPREGERQLIGQQFIIGQPRPCRRGRNRSAMSPRRNGPAAGRRRKWASPSLFFPDCDQSIRQPSGVYPTARHGWLYISFLRNPAGQRYTGLTSEYRPPLLRNDENQGGPSGDAMQRALTRPDTKYGATLRASAASSIPRAWKKQLKGRWRCPRHEYGRHRLYSRGAVRPTVNSDRHRRGRIAILNRSLRCPPSMPEWQRNNRSACITQMAEFCAFRPTPKRFQLGK